MNFMEAVQAMKQGKKVKRPHHLEFIHGLAMAMNENNIKYTPLYEDIEATDWEIVKDKKTLSDKEIRNLAQINVFDKDDVKEHLQEFDDWISTKGFNYNEVKKKLIEIFGDDLR